MPDILESWDGLGEDFVEVMRANDVRVWALDGVIYTNDAAKLQELAAAYDARAAHLQKAISDVKAEAQRRIFEVLPAWKQTNLLAQGLNNTLAFGNDRSKWPADQQAIAAAADLAWAKIVQIRSASNQIEVALNATADWKALRSYEASTDASWPE